MGLIGNKWKMEKILSFFARTGEKIKNLVFPVFCLSCRKEGEWMCEDCLKKLDCRPQFFCSICYRDNSSGRTCENCRSRSYLDGIFSLSDYEKEITAKMIQLLKYEYVEEMAEIFDRMIRSAFKGFNSIPESFFGAGSCIVPVPLHRNRYLDRGFNQAELIARSLAQILNLPLRKDILSRQRFTKTQVGLGRAERQENLIGAFSARGDLSGIKRAVVVDDVFTTGSTLQECARTLKEAGMKEVWGMTAARER